MTMLSCRTVSTNYSCQAEPFILLFPEQDAVITQHTQEQDAFSHLLEDDAPQAQDQEDWLAPRRKAQGDLSLPKTNCFSWRCQNGDIEAHQIEISEDPKFQVSVFHFIVEPGKNEALVHSLKANATYYWRVIGTDSQARPLSSAVSCFRTADEIPRWIRVDGVSNVRDMGGWNTKDGHRVRQGLVFRGGEMRCHMIATAEGLRFVEQELGLRSLLDLRGKGELDVDPTHGSALTASVRWHNTPIAAYAACGSDSYKSLYANAFRIIIEPTNLPLYTHCWGGADRTGTMIFLLNGALGVPEEDLIRDYELTSLSIWGVRSRETEAFKGLLALLESLAPGQDMQAKAIAYWKSIGITDNEILRLQELFLEH